MFSIVRKTAANGRYVVVQDFTDDRKAVLIALILSRTAERAGHTSAYSVYDEYTHIVDVNRHTAPFVSAEYNIPLTTVHRQVDAQ